MFPDAKLTKADVARFYDRISDWIVPHLQGRPLTLVRCPAGLSSDCFFMKHSKVWAPAALRRASIPEKTKVGDYLIADTAAGVVSLVQMDVLEIHTWNTRINNVERPDRIVFDLDPGRRVPWKQVVQTARLVRQMLEIVGLASFPKTTGGAGLHVVAPIVPRADWSECLEFSRAMAEAIDRHAPNLYTTEGRTRTEDPDRLSEEQSDQHINRGVLDPRTQRRAGFHARELGGCHDLAESSRVDRGNGRALAQITPARSVEGLLDYPATPVEKGHRSCTRSEALESLPRSCPLLVSEPTPGATETCAVPVLPGHRAWRWSCTARIARPLRDPPGAYGTPAFPVASSA